MPRIEGKIQMNIEKMVIYYYIDKNIKTIFFI